MSELRKQLQAIEPESATAVVHEVINGTAPQREAVALDAISPDYPGLRAIADAIKSEFAEGPFKNGPQWYLQLGAQMALRMVIQYAETEEFESIVDEPDET